MEGGEARQAPFDFGLWRQESESESECTFSDGRTKQSNAFDKSLLLISQGEEKEKTSEEKKSTGERSDKAALPDDGLSDEVRERKRLSLAAQQVSAANFRLISNCEIYNKEINVFL